MYAARHDSYLANYHRSGVAKILGVTRNMLGKHKDGRNVSVEMTITECKTKDRHTFTSMMKPSRENSSSIDAFNLTLLDGLLEPVICIDAKGIMQYVNHKALELFGYAIDQVKGNNINMLMPNPHRDNHNLYLAEYFKTGKTTVINNTRDTVCELGDGSIVPIRLSVTENILADGSKRFLGTISIRQGGTQRKVSKLVQQRQVIDTLATPAIIINTSGIVQAFNASATKILGYSLEEVLGQNVSMIVGGGHAANHDQYITSYLRSGITKVMGKDRHLFARAKNGREIKILLSVSEHKDETSTFFTGMFFHTN